MPDTIEPTTPTPTSTVPLDTPAAPLADPQKLVDEVLTPNTVTSEQGDSGAAPTQLPASDELPLAFAAPELTVVPVPTVTETPTSNVPLQPVNNLPPITPPPVDTAAKLNEILGDNKPKNKGKLGKIVIGIFVLIAGVVGGVYGYSRIIDKPMIAIIVGEMCTPGDKDTRSCTTDGCAGTQSRTCNSTGSKWSSWSTCSKNNPKCGNDGGDGETAPECQPMEKEACPITEAGVTCAGTKFCQANATWGGCVKNDPTCGPKEPVIDACKKCTPSSGLCINIAGRTPGVNCNNAYDECDSNDDCGGTPTPTRPACNSPTTTKWCDGNSCTIPSEFAGQCWIDHYFCNDVSSNMNTYGCQGTLVKGGKGSGVTTSSFYSACGTEQIDIQCDFCAGESHPLDFVSRINDTKCNNPNDKTEPSTPPSSTPTPTLSCTGLTKDKVTPKIGDVVKFTCAGSVTPAGATNLTYQFRLQKDGGAWQSLTATGVTATYTVAAKGVYNVQCKACGTINNASVCDPIWSTAQ